MLWESRDFAWDAQWKAPNLGLEGLQARLGYVADFIYGHPSQKLWMAGVTGTNGKTSCAQWNRAVARRMRQPAPRYSARSANGLVGGLAPATQTTPDVTVLQEMLQQFHRRARAPWRWKCRRTASSRAASSA